MTTTTVRPHSAGLRGAHGARSLLAWASLLVAVALLAAGGVPSDPPSALADLAALLMVTVGVLLMTRVGSNPVGWLLWLTGLMLAASLGFDGLASAGVMLLGPVAAVTWLAWAGAMTSQLPFLLAAGLLPLVFPTGRLLSPRWRIVVALAIAAGTLELLATAIGPGSNDTYPPGVANPILVTGQPGAVISALFGVGQDLGGALMVLGIAAVVVRFRRASGVERQQMKWFTFAAVATVAALGVAVALNSTSGEAPSIVDNTAWTATFAGVVLLPVAIGMAVLRYHLYEIDRIISRTVGWAVVTVVTVAVFSIGVVGLQALLAGLTQGQTLAVAASTLLAFALFQPVRRQVQRAVDRRFDRARYDGERIALAFGERLRAGTGLEAAGEELTATARAAVHPRSAILWLRGEARS